MDTLNHKKPHRQKPNADTSRWRRNRFLSCFGFSPQVIENDDAAKSPPDPRGWEPHEADSTRQNAAVLSETSSREAKMQRSVNPEPQAHAQVKSPIPPPPSRRISPLAGAARAQIADDDVVAKTKSGTRSIGPRPPGPDRPVRMRRADVRRVGRGPVAGVSILAVMLVILFIWGRLCALLCTSVLFYCVPRVKRTDGNDDEDDDGDKNDEINGSDVLDHGYNERVVLQGFLRRDGRPTAAVL
ncbi:hypothetical protein Dimus_019474 [Dionaea muscipula]